MYLRSLTSIPEGFNPTVGGDLDLRSLTSIPEGFNPTVGGNLYLGGLTSIPEGFNPTVGGDLDLGYGLTANTKHSKKQILPNRLLFWQNGKYVCADGIITEVVNKKGNVYKVKKIHSDKEFYLVTNGEINAHGETLQQAKDDFRFKLVADKLKTEPITADTIITKQYYRLVTGACEFGVQSFIDSNFSGEEKKKVETKGIKAKDLLPILKKNNAYGFDKFNSLINF